MWFICLVINFDKIDRSIFFYKTFKRYFLGLSDVIDLRVLIDALT